MPTGLELTYFDYVVAAILLFFLIRGAWIGFFRQLAAFFALVGSYFLAGHYADRILPVTERFVHNPRLTFLVSFVLIFIAAALVFTLIGRILHRFMQIILLGWFNRLAGMAVGAVKAAVLASLLYMLLASSLSATNDLLRKSISAPYLKQGAALLQSLINDPRIRARFNQKEPAIAPDQLKEKEAMPKPDRPADQPAARQAVRQAEPSVKPATDKVGPEQH